MPIVELENLWQRQQRRAQELHDGQLPQTKVVETEVEELYEMPRQERHAYEESYIEHVPCTVPYDDLEAYQDTQYATITVTRSGTKRCKGIRGSFGMTEACEYQEAQQVPVQSTLYRKVQKERPSTRPETKTRTVYRKVTRYETKTRMKTVQTSVEYTLSVTHFYRETLDQVLAEIRATFAAPGGQGCVMAG